MQLWKVDFVNNRNNDSSAQPIVNLYSWSITLRRAFVVVSRIGRDIEQTISEEAVEYSEIKTEKCRLYILVNP